MGGNAPQEELGSLSSVRGRVHGGQTAVRAVPCPNPSLPVSAGAWKASFAAREVLFSRQQFLESVASAVGEYQGGV